MSSIDLEENPQEKFLTNLNKLNPEQRQAVNQTEGPVMVLAGPGTGKTQVLATRIANILNNPDLQMNPENILCLTFTESGVVAMRNRLISIIGTPAYYVRIHTFHSFCNEIIQENPEIFPNLSSVSEVEQIEIIETLISQLEAKSLLKPFGDPYMYKGEILNNIKLLKRESIKPEELENGIKSFEFFIEQFGADIEAFISQNARKLKEEDCIVFIDNLSQTVKSLADDLVFKPLLINYIITFRKFWSHSTKIAEFKKLIKDFYEKFSKELSKQYDLLTIYKGYLRVFNERKLYDFEDMILFVIKAFASALNASQNDTNPAQKENILAKYQEQFQYILVDEYQDTNGSQKAILDLLTSYYQDQSNIFVVGDDDQSIYKFQGASLENVSSFYRTFRNTIQVVCLNKNYRSQQNILDLSHHLVSHNQDRVTDLIEGLDKKLQSQRQDFNLKPVNINIHKDHSSEMFFLVNSIKDLIKSGTAASEIAVLVRSNKDVIQLADLFQRSNIPFKSYTNKNILDDIYIAQLLDLMRVIAKPKAHSYLLFNLLHYDFIFKSLEQESEIEEKVSPFSLEKLWQLHKQNRDSELSLIELMLEDEMFKGFAKKILDFHQRSFNTYLDELFEETIHEFKYLDFVLNTDEDLTNLQSLNELFSEIKDLQRAEKIRKTYHDSGSVLDIYKLEDFIKHVDLLRENRLSLSNKSEEILADVVQIMTAHKSKGLEFEHVFMHKCIDKVWGNPRSYSKLKLPPCLVTEVAMQTKESLNEEERRLFFVAMTRAKKELHLNYYQKDSQGKDVTPSIFIEELKTYRNKEQFSLNDMSDMSNSTENSAEDLYQSLIAKNLAFLKPSKEKEFPLDKLLLEKILADYKLSVTHLNTFLGCARKFYYQHILRVPSAKSKHASFGTAIHNSLYEIFTLLKKAPAFNQNDSSNSELNHNLYKTKLLESFEKYLKAEFLDEKDYDDSLSLGKDALTKYYDKYSSNFITKTELEFDHKSLEYNGIKLTGKIDKIEILDPVAKTVNVVDYKTGNPASKRSALKAGTDYHRQIVFYQLLCDLALKEGTFKYRMISGELDFVQQDNAGEFYKDKIIVRNEDIENLRQEIEVFKKQVFNHEFEMTSDTKKCDRCQFKNLCER